MNQRSVMKVVKLRSFAVVGALLGMLVPACSNDFTALVPGTVTIRIESGNGQSAVVGRELAKPLVVIVTDVSGKALAGVVVRFRTASGNGTVFPAVDTTNRSGLATT